ncbi:hypothetical protein LI224_18115, partial [Erysipelatoclostridium ramosum]|uniref:hypothetical protein n=1 Tax=Thomasclavelia ramosa TaxID=1547 RepID=UPI001D072A3C
YSIIKKAGTWQFARYLLEFARKAAGMGAGGYMASCHVAIEYRIRLLSQGPGRIFLTEDLHPAYGSLTVPPCAV